MNFQKKAAKAAGRLYKLSTYNYISIQTLLEAFNSLMKPIFAGRRRSAVTMSAFYCNCFFLGLQISICFVSDVLSYDLVLFTEGSYTTMRMPRTTDSRISEMEIVGQPLLH